MTEERELAKGVSKRRAFQAEQSLKTGPQLGSRLVYLRKSKEASVAGGR